MPSAVTVVVAYAGLAIYVVALIVRPAWLVRRPLFDVVLGAGIAGHLRALLVRLPHIATLIVFELALLRGFHVAVPVLAALAVLPIVFLVAALPISVQGLGTTQAAMIYFFARYAPGDWPAQQATIMAASLVGQALALGLQALIGVVCLRSRVGRSIGQNPTISMTACCRLPVAWRPGIRTPRCPGCPDGAALRFHAAVRPCRGRSRGSANVSRRDRFALFILLLFVVAFFVNGVLGLDFGAHWDEWYHVKVVSDAVQRMTLLPEAVSYGGSVLHARLSGHPRP